MGEIPNDPVVEPSYSYGNGGNEMAERHEMVSALSLSMVSQGSAAFAGNGSGEPQVGLVGASLTSNVPQSILSTSTRTEDRCALCQCVVEYISVFPWPRCGHLLHIACASHIRSSGRASCPECSLPWSHDHDTFLVDVLVNNSSASSSVDSLPAVQEVSADEGESQPQLRGRSCPVCIDPILPPSGFVWSGCLHTLHRTCALDLHRRNLLSCPECRCPWDPSRMTEFPLTPTNPMPELPRQWELPDAFRVTDPEGEFCSVCNGQFDRRLSAQWLFQCPTGGPLDSTVGRLS